MISQHLWDLCTGARQLAEGEPAFHGAMVSQAAYANLVRMAAETFDPFAPPKPPPLITIPITVRKDFLGDYVVLTGPRGLPIWRIMPECVHNGFRHDVYESLWVTERSTPNEGGDLGGK